MAWRAAWRGYSWGLNDGALPADALGLPHSVRFLRTVTVVYGYLQCQRFYAPPTFPAFASLPDSGDDIWPLAASLTPALSVFPATWGCEPHLTNHVGSSGFPREEKEISCDDLDSDARPIRQHVTQA